MTYVSTHLSQANHFSLIFSESQNHPVVCSEVLRKSAHVGPKKNPDEKIGFLGDLQSSPCGHPYLG